MSFHDIVHTLLVNRKVLLRITTLSIIFLFLILLFVYPVTYSSPVKIMPPENNKYSGLGSLLGGGDVFSIFDGGISGSSSQLFAEVLKSRSAAEYVIEKCGLYSYYRTNDINKAAESLRKDLDVEVNKEGIITCGVNVSTSIFGRFSDQKEKIKLLSADISNAYAEALDSINREKLNSKAKRSRRYIETQLLTTKSAMDSVEIALRNFQEANKTISLPEQLSAAIETAAKLKSEIILTEIQLGTFAENLNRNSQPLEALNSKLDQLKKQYAQIEGGEKINGDYLPSFTNIPKISLELARLMREVKIQNEVYLLLQKQYYAEKIQENRDIPTVEVLDRAIPSAKEKSPRIVFHTVFGGISIFLLVSLFIVVLSRKNNL